MARFLRRMRRFRMPMRGRRRRPSITRNHFELDVTQTTGGTAQNTTVATGVDDTSNRSTHIPDGAILKYIIVEAQCETVNAGKYSFGLWRQPGGISLSTDLTNDYYTTTDPITTAMRNARVFKLAGPKTIVQASAAVAPVRIFLKWRGSIKWRDGDDVLFATNMPATNQVADCRIAIGFIHR